MPTLTAGQASLVLTGRAAGLDRTLVVGDIAQYLAAGSGAGLLHSYVLAANQVACVFSGAAAGLVKVSVFSLAAETAHVVVAGADVRHPLLAETTQFGVTPYEAAISTVGSLSLLAASTAFALSGNSAETLSLKRITAESAACILGGLDARLLFHRVLGAGSQSFSLSGGEIEGAAELSSGFYSPDADRTAIVPAEHRLATVSAEVRVGTISIERSRIAASVYVIRQATVPFENRRLSA